jgi:hypothetical protein
MPPFLREILTWGRESSRQVYDLKILHLPTSFSEKSFRKYLSNKPGKREIKELQKTAISGTAQIIRKYKRKNTKRVSWQTVLQVGYHIL